MLLATLESDPLVVHAARTLLTGTLTAVVGHEAERVRAALGDADLDVAVRYNADHADGQSTSVRVGAAAADERGWDAAVCALGDTPWVDPETSGRLAAAYRAGAGSILAPSIDGHRGTPVLFDAVHFDALATRIR